MALTAKSSMTDAIAVLDAHLQVGLQREKAAMANGLRGALLGGGLGVGASALRSMFSDDEDAKQHWLRNALTTGMLGAGLGGASGAGYDLWKNMPQAPADPPPSPVISAGQSPGVLSQLVSAVKDTYGVKPEAPLIDNAVGVLGNYGQNKALTAGATAAGYGLGGMVDKWRAPMGATTLSNDAMKALTGPAAENAKALQQALSTPGASAHNSGVGLRRASPPASPPAAPDWLRQLSQGQRGSPGSAAPAVRPPVAATPAAPAPAAPTPTTTAPPSAPAAPFDIASMGASPFDEIPASQMHSSAPPPPPDPKSRRAAEVNQTMRWLAGGGNTPHQSAPAAEVPPAPAPVQAPVPAPGAPSNRLHQIEDTIYRNVAKAHNGVRQVGRGLQQQAQRLNSQSPSFTWRSTPAVDLPDGTSVEMTPQLKAEMQQKLRPRTGRTLGALTGFAGAPFLARLFSNDNVEVPDQPSLPPPFSGVSSQTPGF